MQRTEETPSSAGNPPEETGNTRNDARDNGDAAGYMAMTVGAIAGLYLMVIPAVPIGWAFGTTGVAAWVVTMLVGGAAAGWWIQRGDAQAKDR